MKLLIISLLLISFSAFSNEKVEVKKVGRIPASVKTERVTEVDSHNVVYKIKDDSDGVLCYVIRAREDVGGNSIFCLKK